ncbi:uncharacterized protein N7477_008663 [Penicillium maclennaniae]|uniref:uncharacterized protein n=1 Tax=Penicillium maclennaniae TaxID=1343394 RepID=UPI00253FFF7C|nr:uncharacterized protein N7477_008663 [Penicillium maclennaniae]KAJ5666215.1 hypothetical protein N7477_008663 [Penicillium maclennaniae]
MRDTRTRLQTATTATTLATSRVGGGGGDILNAANAHTSTGEGTEGRLGTGTGGLGAVTTGGTDLDVQSVDAKLLAAGSDVLGSQHGGVGEDSSRSALTFIPPVTRVMVSRPL